MKFHFSMLIGLIFPMVLGCSAEESGKSDSSEGSQVASMKSSVNMDVSNVDLSGKELILAGVTFKTPGEWKDYGEKGMRKADYSFGPIGEETDSASVSVFYFGPDGGGGVMDNINRWVSQMSLPDGSDPDEAAVKGNFEVSGMVAHTVEVFGTFQASMGGPMSGNAVPKEQYRLVAVVLETAQGNLFFKLTGPDKTSTKMTAGFLAMIKSARIS